MARVKVRCLNEKKNVRCAHLDLRHHICLAKKTGGGKRPTVFPNKARKCGLYDEAPIEEK
ncbi:MAG: hypothetical protein HY720_14870 [Planctomycetes bacterium]|nr:hypothetical protein [Planctomycetota bacterium]